MSALYTKSVHYYGKRGRDYARDTVTGYGPNHVVELVRERVIEVREEIAAVWFVYVAATVGLLKLAWLYGGEARNPLITLISITASFIGILWIRPWLLCKLSWYKQWYEMNKDLRERSKQPYWWLNQ